MSWFTKASSTDSSEDNEEFFRIVKSGDIEGVLRYLRSHDTKRALGAVERSSKKSALHIAAKYGFEKLVEVLINKGANTETKDKLLKSPLHYACEYGHKMIVDLLLNQGADFMDVDCSGRTTVHYAVYSGRIEILDMLAACNIDLITTSDHAKRTPLHHAVFMDYSDRDPNFVQYKQMVKRLIDLGANVNSLDCDKRTPLHHAAEANIGWAVDILVKSGAMTHAKDGLARKTPLELAPNDKIRSQIIAFTAPELMAAGGDEDSLK